MTEVLTGALYDGGVGGWSYVVAKVGVDLPGSLLPGRWCTFAGGKSGRRRRRRENLSTFAAVLMSFIDIFHRNTQPKHKNFAPAARYDYHSAFGSTIMEVQDDLQ